MRVRCVSTSLLRGLEAQSGDSLKETANVPHIYIRADLPTKTPHSTFIGFSFGFATNRSG